MKPDELIEEIETIYEDEDFIVLNKPAGVLTIPDRFARGIPNLYDILKKNTVRFSSCIGLIKKQAGSFVLRKMKRLIPI